ncbi:MAG: hypothetical protein JKY55_16975 [Aliivibrio sp.]|uniref:hypothetical protein n=1 Tax=Aliivibrio sp. TaxID=1872443 RepID=UPI001A63F193|nr:hypothetical protein [Aliivibrio sp.]
MSSIFNYYIVTCMGIRGFSFVFSPMILSFFKKEKGEKVGLSISMLFSRKDFLTEKGIKVQVLLRRVFLWSFILTIINILISWVINNVQW